MRARNTGKTGVWLAVASMLGVGGVLFIAVLAMTAAVLGASFTGCQSGEAAASTGPAPSAYALQSIPPERLRLYERAGVRSDIDWSFLASIGAQECASGTCTGVNSSGCAGPMQIAYVRDSPCSPGKGPTLWERFAVNADPTTALSVNDPADAVFTAARILRQAMGAPPAGGSFAAYRQAACAYYGACTAGGVAYAEQVMARAITYGFDGPGSPPATPRPALEAVAGNGEQCDASVLAPEAASSSAIARVAESQIGQGENPAGSGCTVYGPCEEWCSLFAAWVWQHAGVPLPGPTALYGYSGSLYTWASSHGGRLLPASARPSPGDAVFYGTGPSASAHVGIVVRVLADGEIETVEGNYAGQVSRVGPFARSRPVGERAGIYGYAQPPTPLAPAGAIERPGAPAPAKDSGERT
jgi:CHAP domain